MQGPAAGVLDVSPQCQHEEQPAEQAFPLGEPGDRFDVQRMNGEDRGHEGAWPKPAGHAPENKEEKDRRSAVQQDVGEMVAVGLQTIELVIGQVGDPGDRCPLAAVRGRACPANPLGAETLADGRVAAEVHLIVVIDEAEVDRLREDEPHR